jgi:lysophospholipase L1-like esterase
MMRSHAKTLIALPLLAVLVACGGGGGGAGVPAIPATHGNAPHSHSSILARIVGVGDSLTAGYQSNGFLGETGVHNPLAPGTQLPPGQENGWWALLDEQSSGLPLETAIKRMYDPAVSPLPLIKGPGLNDLIVPSTLTPPVPFGSLITGDTCTANHGFNLAGYRFRGMTRVRLNPTSTNIRNVGVPGLTLHEANVLHQPQSSTCTQLPGIVGLLNMVVADESGTFWPVLGNFTHLQGNLTDVNAAASVHPTLATVWLGANDVLKYMGSGGRFHGGDMTPGQVSQDLHQTIGTLQKAGAKVVVANLPNILETGYFQRVSIPGRPKLDCALRTYAYCLIFDATGLPGSVLTPYFKQYGLVTPGGCTPTSLTRPCGYLTLSGVVTVIQYATNEEGALPDLDCAVPAPKCKPVPGSGLGSNYITPQFAARVQELNNAVNQGIDAAASSTRVPLVNIQDIFHGLASGDPSNPYFAAAASINPGVCCTLGYLYGILSFDGLHPSNTGYALIAYNFIKVINQAYHTHIPEVDVKAVYDGSRCSDKRYCFPDPFAPPNDAS